MTVSYITLLLPFGALAFGAALYDERVTLAAIGGALLVASGLLIAQWPRRGRRPRLIDNRAACMPQPAPLRRPAVRPQQGRRRAATSASAHGRCARSTPTPRSAMRARSTPRRAARRAPREGHDALAAAAPAAATASSGTPSTAGRSPASGACRDEDDGPTGDAAVDEAFDGLGDTWDFWQDVFSRDSIDDENMPLRGIVHFGEEYPNAFWDGRRMVFGDGDGEIFLRFTKSLDVIGHELGHGVIEDEAGARVLGPVRRAQRALRRRRRRSWSSSASSARPPTRPTG